MTERLWKGKQITLGVIFLEFQTYSDNYTHYYNWYVTSEDLTQWIDYMKELDSNFTWDVKLLLDLDSSPGLGSPSVGIGFQPTTLDVMPEMGFQKKEQLLEK